MVAEVLAALDLQDVVLVGNDTGGVVTQLVAVHHREWLGALVLTSCDAFEHFPPPILRPLLLAAKSKTLFRTAIQAVRAPAVRTRASCIWIFRVFRRSAIDLSCSPIVLK